MPVYEIYDKTTREVVDTVEFDDLRSFLDYWLSQCNTQDYAYRRLPPRRERAWWRQQQQRPPTP